MVEYNGSECTRLYFLRDLKEDYDLINQHLEKRKSKSVSPEKPELKFAWNDSHKKSVYDLLKKNKNSWVNKKTIMREVGINYDDFRPIIYQLRQDIISQNKEKLLCIENNDRKSEYKLTILASISSH